MGISSPADHIKMPQKCLPLLAAAVKSDCTCSRGSRNKHVPTAKWLQLTVGAQKWLLAVARRSRHAFLSTAPAVVLLTLLQRVGNKCWQSLKTAAATAKGIMVKLDIAVRLLHHWRWLWAEAALTPILAQADRSRQTEIQGKILIEWHFSYLTLDHMLERHLRQILLSVFSKNFIKKHFQNHHLYFSLAQLPSCDKSNFLSELSSVNIHLLFSYARPTYHQKSTRVYSLKLSKRKTRLWWILLSFPNNLCTPLYIRNYLSFWSLYKMNSISREWNNSIVLLINCSNYLLFCWITKDESYVWNESHIK